MNANVLTTAIICPCRPTVPYETKGAEHGDGSGPILARDGFSVAGPARISLDDLSIALVYRSYSSIFEMSSLSSTSDTLASCELYDLVIDMNWDAVAKHAKEHPEDAKFIDGEWKETPLYGACQNDPSEQAVRALLQAYPPAVRLGSKRGDLPLHIACRWRASIGVIRALIEHDPSTVCVATKYGKTPLAALWEEYTKSNNEQTYQLTCEKSTMLLEAVAHYQGLVAPETGEPLCLHAAMKMECNDALLHFVMEEYRHQTLQHDRKGRLPLHLAVEPGITSRRKLWRCVFENLIEQYPEAARISDPVSGRLPLHTMVSNRFYTWNEIEVIFKAYPQAVVDRDPVTGLLPFALSHSVETSFCLLNARPDVVAGCSVLSCRDESESFHGHPFLVSAMVAAFLSLLASYAIAAAFT